MSADAVKPGKPPMRLVIALLAAFLGATALIVGWTSGEDPLELPKDAVSQGDIAVYGAYVREPATNTAAAYFTMTNAGDTDDVLVAVSTPVAASASMHDIGIDPPTGEEGMDSDSMTPTPNVRLQPGATITLQPAGGHIMLEGLRASLQPGTTVNLQLIFENAGTITIKAPVIGITDTAPTQENS